MTLQTIQTTNFRIEFDDTAFDASDVPQVQARAQYLASHCEADMTTLCSWFDVTAAAKFGPSNQVIVTLTDNVRGASNSGYSTNNSKMIVNPEIGSPDEFVMLLFVDELSEILMSVVGGWNPGDSGGEGLSRACGALLHPSEAPVNVNAWLFADPTKDTTAAVADDVFRKDWVSTNFEGGPLKAGGNVAGDQDAYSVGCSLLYLFYLKSQEDYSMAQIAQAMPLAAEHDTPTLSAAYRQLTGSTISPFAQFKRLIDAHFPAPGGALKTNDPFPLAFTNVSPAATAAGKTVFVFTPMTDGQLAFNQAAPGGAFVGWQPFPGAETSNASLTGDMLGNTIYVFSKRASGDVVYTTAAVGGAFSDWRLAPGGEKTNVAPAAAGRPGELFLFLTSVDGRVLFNQIGPNGAFVGWQEVPGGMHTTSAPSAAMRGTTLFLFATDANGGVHFNQAESGGAFVGWQAMAGAPQTSLPVASAARTGNLFVFAVAKDQTIHFNQAEPGGAFVGWQVMPGDRRTSVAVAAGMQNGSLVVFSKEADGRIVFNQAAPGGAFVGWQLLR